MKQADKNIIHSIGWIRQPNDRKDLILEEIEKQISRMNLSSNELKSKCLIRSSLKIHLKNGGNFGKQFLDFINSNDNQPDEADRGQSSSPVEMITDRKGVQSLNRLLTLTHDVFKKKLFDFMRSFYVPNVKVLNTLAIALPV